jgi:hypothetical protein
METPTTMNNAEYLAFRAKHETALSALRAYALDCQLDADRLNPILHARDIASMVEATPSLYRYLACSTAIDELYHELIALAVSRTS